MAALDKNRYTDQLGEDGRRVLDPVAAGAHVFTGALVVLDADGNAAPGTTATGLKARGVAQEEQNNTGGVAGARWLRSERGVFCFDNDGSVNRTHLETTGYIVDDHTIAADDGGGTRSPAGRIVDVDDDGVWTRVGP